MVKKERKISIPNFDKSQFVQPEGALPSSVEVNQTIAHVTGKPLQPSESGREGVVEKTVATRPKGRPKKILSKDRVPFNTMVNISISDELKILAVRRRVSTADLIELALTQFLDNQGIKFKI